MSRRAPSAARVAVSILTLAALLPLEGAALGEAEPGRGQRPPALRLSDRVTFDGAFSDGSQQRYSRDAVLTRRDPAAAVQVMPTRPAIVHVDAPPGSGVSVILRHEAGSLVRLTGVSDASGRFFDPDSVSRTTQRIRYESVPVLDGGGLDLAIENGGDVASVAHLSVRLDEAGAGDPGDFGPLAWTPGRILVDYSAAGMTAQDLADTLGLTLLEDHGDFAVFGTGIDVYGTELSALSGYVRIFPGGNGLIEVDALATPPEGSQRNSIIVGSDFGRSYPRQPALRMTHMPVARLLDGSGTIIAVVDSGVDDTHPALMGTVLLGHDFIDGDELPREERTGLDGDGDGRADEGYGHGTMVASIALAVAPGAKILPVRVLDSDGRGTVSGVAAGVRWAVDNGADIINLSLGTPAASRVLTDAVAYARAQGVLIVVASGNAGDPYAVDFPGTLPGVISVAALNARGQKAGWTNGRKVATLTAPGAGIIGAYPGATWGMGRGTSFSAPLVSGGAALCLQAGAQGKDWIGIASMLVSGESPNDRRLDFRRLLQPWPSFDLAAKRR